MDNCISVKSEDGYSMTLTTMALKYLIEAETDYGPRTTEFIYGGVELVDEEQPLFWFPFDKYVVIRVTPRVITDLKDAIFQIAHEVIHILSPSKKETTNNLEEGLATWFSLKVAERDGDDSHHPIDINSLRKYRYPYELVYKLLSLRPDAIFELRKVQPVLGSVNKNDFKKANIDISQDLIVELVKQMEY